MTIRNWVEAARPFSLTAALIPVLVGTALARGTGVHVGALNFIVVLIGGILLQVGTNMVNDAYDYWNGVDSLETPRASRVVIEGRLDPKLELTGGLLVFLVTLLLGVLLAVRVTPWVLVPVVLGIIAGHGYTAPPLAYKYRGLGIPLVFLLMGPIMAWAGYLGVGGTHFWWPMLVSLPVGFLVAAILHANDLRDIEDDRSAHITTLTGLLGYGAARLLYWVLMLAPYLTVAILVVAGKASAWTLLTWGTLPMAILAVGAARVPGRERLAVLDQRTAKIHLLFGLLLAIGLGVVVW